MSKEVKCNLCQSDNYEILESQFNYNLAKCNNCGLAYVTPQPELEAPEKTYSKAYYDKWLIEKKKTRQRMWRKRLAVLDANQKKGKLLDVGCGFGTFLKLAQQNGWKVQGTEVSSYAAEKCREELNVQVFDGELEKASLPDNTFDAITIWHVLEHLPNPLETLREVHRILKKDGLLILAVPNFNSLLAKIKLTRQKGTQRIFRSDSNEPHLYHLTPKTLRKMVEKAGFKVIKIALDEPSVSTLQIVYDKLTKAFYFLSRINIGRAILGIAKKKR